jgi:hypothetical protein
MDILGPGTRAASRPTPAPRTHERRWRGHLEEIEVRRREIEVAKERWTLRFYCWGGTITLLALTVQAGEFVAAAFEHRHPTLVSPWQL